MCLQALDCVVMTTCLLIVVMRFSQLKTAVQHTNGRHVSQATTRVICVYIVRCSATLVCGNSFN